MIVSDTHLAQSRGGGTVLGRIVAFRKSTVLLPAGIGLAIAYAGYQATPPRFSSEAVLVLDARKIQALPTESVVSPLPQESPVLRSELDIIASQTMAERVLHQLSPTTIAMLQSPPPKLTLGRLAEYFFATPSSASAATGAAPAAGVANKEALQRTLLSNLDVSNDGRSYTIFISFTASEPQLAADVANAFATSYLSYQVDVQGAGTRQVSEWLGHKLNSLRATLEASERALSDFRANNDLVNNDNQYRQGRVAQIETEYLTAKADLSAAQAKLDVALQQLEQRGDLSVPENSGDLLMQGLKGELFRIERQIKLISDSGATMSAELPGLRSQAEVIRQQIDEASRHTIEMLTANVDVARRRVEAAERALEAARDELEEAGRARVHEAQLEREAAANRSIYESYLARYKQTIEQDGIASPDARIISRAEVTKVKTSPRLINWLSVGLALGGLLGLGVAFVRELTDRRIRSAALLAEQTGYPVLGAVPVIAEKDREGMATSPSTSRVFEALAPLGAMVRRIQLARGARVIAVTSNKAGEGKSTVALNLARTMSAAGANVLLVQCSPLAESEGEERSVRTTGRGARARTDTGLNSLITVDEESGVSFLGTSLESGRGGPQIAGKELRDLLSRLRDRFDTILLDGPALSDSFDAWRLSALADGVIMVVCKSRSNSRDAKVVTDQLRDYGCNIFGIVIDRHVDGAAFPAPQPAAGSGITPFAGLHPADTGVA